MTHVKTPSFRLAHGRCTRLVSFPFLSPMPISDYSEFLLMSEPVKAAKCCTVQFIAVVQSGTRPKVTHLATSLPGMKSESRDCLLPHSVWGRLGITVASGQLAECGNQVDTATAYSAQFIPGASRSQAGAFECRPRCLCFSGVI